MLNMIVKYTPVCRRSEAETACTKRVLQKFLSRTQVIRIYVQTARGWRRRRHSAYGRNAFDHCLFTKRECGGEIGYAHRSVAVYDVSGKMLKSVKGGNNLILISGLPRQQVLVVKVVLNANDANIRQYKLIII